MEAPQNTLIVSEPASVDPPDAAEQLRVERQEARTRAKQCGPEEYRKRIQFVKDRLSKGYHPSDIKSIVHTRYGLAPRSAEFMMCRARRELLQQIGKTKKQLRAESYHNRMQALQQTKVERNAEGEPILNDDGDPREIPWLSPTNYLEALNGIDKLLALPKTQTIKSKNTHKHSGPVETVDLTEILAKVTGSQATLDAFADAVFGDD